MLYVEFTTLKKPTQIGFIVSKAVGNAVTRNLVKRRLREIAVTTVRRFPEGMNLVVRALPAAANASWDELVDDYQRAFARAAHLGEKPLVIRHHDDPKATADGEKRVEGDDVRDPSQA